MQTRKNQGLFGKELKKFLPTQKIFTEAADLTLSSFEFVNTSELNSVLQLSHSHVEVGYFWKMGDPWKMNENPQLTLPKQALLFTCLQYKSFENTVGKGEIARNEQFLLFPQCFLPICRTFYHFNHI